MLELFSSSSSLSTVSELSSLPELENNYYFNSIQERVEIYKIIGIGDAIVDVTSHINSELIGEYRMKLGDSIFANEDSLNNKNIEIFDALERMPTVNYIPGGSVQNSLRTISWALSMDNNDRKKYQVTMLGSVGDDLYKNKILNALEDIGVNPLLQILKNDKTSRCGVGIYNKEKLFVTQLRASKRLSEEFIQENLENILEHQILLIEGYLLQNKYNIVSSLCELFSRNNKMVILTLSAKFIVQTQRGKLMELADKSDIINGSMEEAREMAENRGETKEEIFEIIFRKLRPKNNRLLLFTDGANGAYCATYDYKRMLLENVYECSAERISDEEIEDLNGAGDAFLGGFLSEYMKGYSITDCLKNGTNAASVILRNVGCTFPKNLRSFKNDRKIYS